MTNFTLAFDSSVQDIPCGERASGLTVGRNAGGGQNVHLLFPADLAYAPGLSDLFAELESPRLHRADDGRCQIKKPAGNQTDDRTAAFFLEQIETALSERGRGGIAEKVYGVYTVSHARDGWDYLIQSEPSGHASIKRLGWYDAARGVFRVPHDNRHRLFLVLLRASKAVVKGQEKPISLPKIPGLSVRIEGGEILVAWPGKSEAERLHAIPTLQWDAKKSAYAVSTRYATSLSRVLTEIGEMRATAERNRQEQAEARRQKKLAEEAARPRASAEAIKSLTDLATDLLGISDHGDGTLNLHLSYNPECIRLIKALPARVRRWNADKKVWQIDTSETEEVLKKIGETLKEISEILDRKHAEEQAAKNPNEHRIVVVAGYGQDVGNTIVYHDSEFRIVRRGGSFTIDGDTPSLYGYHLLGYEGDRARVLYVEAI